MRQALIVGSGSDIAKELQKRLTRDGWRVEAVPARSDSIPDSRWDLLILAHGKLAPIGRFFDVDWKDWLDCIAVNAWIPLAALRYCWPRRNEGATVVFMGGPNMAKPSPTYTAYRAGKAVLESLVWTLSREYPEARFKILHPGVCNTKIHQQTIEAGDKAENIERVRRIVSGEEDSADYEDVYDRLKALL